MYGCFICMCVCARCVCLVPRSEESIGSLGTGLIDSGELPDFANVCGMNQPCSISTCLV